jgi:hypothetical protein
MSTAQLLASKQVRGKCGDLIRYVRTIANGLFGRFYRIILVCVTTPSQRLRGALDKNKNGHSQDIATQLSHFQTRII